MRYITTKTLEAGQPGSLKEVNKFGDKLICVRYKYNPETNKKIKTVELIVENKTIANSKKRIPFNKKVFVKIEYYEKKLQKIVKSAGAVWHSSKKLWKIQYGDAYNLGLENRIVKQ